MKSLTISFVSLAAVFSIFVALTLFKLVPYGGSAVIESAVALTTFVVLTRMRDPDRHSARPHAWVSMGGTVLLTWSASVSIAFAFAAWAPAADREKQGLLALVLLVAPNIGGVFALTRSVRTRSETGATLRELSTIRVAALSTPVIEESVRVYEATDVGDLAVSVTRMLRLTISLPLTRDLLDKAALWVRDDRLDVWFMIASSNMGVQDFEFTMARLVAETSGAGIIANLAIATPPVVTGCTFADGVFLCASNLSRHPWYKPSAGGTAEAMAVVMLRDGGDTVGALSLTTRRADLVPLSGTQHAELVDVLRFWSHSFLVAVRRLRALEATGGERNA